MSLGALKSVPWPTAVALVLGGALSVVGVLLIINSGSSRAGARSEPGRDVPSPAGRQPGHAQGERPAAATRHPAGVTLAKLVGQRFMVALRGVAPTEALLEDARRGEIGGVLLFPEGSGKAAVRGAVTELQSAARQGHNPQLLIATDQEGGPIKRFAQGPPRRALSSGITQQQAAVEGQRTGTFLEAMGINTDLAPVADLGLPGSFIAGQGRTISADPQTVTAVAGGFVAGLQQTQTLAVAKHFPGLGSAAVNTDQERSEVTAPVDESLHPFAALSGLGVKGVMVSTAIYRELDPEHGAAWSRRIVTGLLRDTLGFEGLIFSDDLTSTGVRESLSAPEAAREAAEAGVDILMIGEPSSFHPALRTVLGAAKHGKLPLSQLVDSYARIRAAKEWAR
jgi:beta-N-acetylhexosaminidase